jgi:alpha-glucosidase
MRFRVFAALIVLAWSSMAPAASPVEVRSPDGRVRFELIAGGDHLSYAVRMGDRIVLEPSRLGILVDGVDLGRSAELGKVETYEGDETYPTRGVHSRAVNRYRGARVAARDARSGTAFTIDVRAFDDGVGFRFVVPGEGKRVLDEATSFRPAAGSTAWYHDLRGHYEGVHARKAVAETKAGEWAAVPLTFRLPAGRGYASITESSIAGYAGMALQTDGAAGFAARLGHSHPASHPYTLRYGEDEAKRLSSPAAISGTITSPWRVVIVGPDLNTLVNSDLVNNLAPPPDPTFFPKGLDTDWIKPGRAVWKFLDGGESSLAGMKEFSRLAGELGFEYNVIEGFWQRWTDAQLRELVDESRSRGVGIWLWKHSKELRTPEARRAFFEKCRAAGVVGAKIDFFDHEAKEVVDLYPTLLREAAGYRLMLDFHGANKPTGEPRTWPNELGREGVYGLEHRGMAAWARHDATLPFTRLLAGHADYTPTIFGERRKETSWPHQIADAVVMTAPLQVYGGHPKSLLENPAVEMIKSIPSVWDETIVLPASEIGEVAVFARRKGDRWFLAVVNGAEPRSLRVPASFLGDGSYRASLVRDRSDNPAAVVLESATVSRDDTLTIDLRAGGGFAARFDKP